MMPNYKGNFMEICGLFKVTKHMVQIPFCMIQSGSLYE